MTHAEHEHRGGQDPMFSAASDHATMMRMIFHPRLVAQVVRSVAEFSLADHLADGPASGEQIASLAGLEPEAALRLLRFCIVLGLVTSKPDGCFAATPLLQTLRSDDPASLKSFAMAVNGPGQWKMLGKLTDALRTGLPQAEAALGCSIYDYYSRPENEAEGNAYRHGLEGVNRLLAADVAQMVDTREISSALDVGGSLGSIVMALMAENPSLRGTVLDLAAAEKEALRAARSRGFAERFEFQVGDFFVEVPPSELYILKNVLGNWPEDRCLSILENCRKSAPQGARIVVIEIMSDEANPTPWSVDEDIITLVAVGGKTRSNRGYERLLATAGFRFSKTLPTSTPLSLMQAVAA